MPVAIYSHGPSPSVFFSFWLLTPAQDSQWTLLPEVGHRAGDDTGKGRSAGVARTEDVTILRQGKEIRDPVLKEQEVVGCNQSAREQSLPCPISGPQCPSKG